MSKKAPITLFTYNRLDHTKKTVEALKVNIYAKESDLFVFSDGAKSEKDKEAVQAVRSYLKTIEGFNQIEIFERKANAGLAHSIIDGISLVVCKYGKVIVVEDDIVTSPYFLSYMNAALDYYEREKKVWHISGWTPGISKNGLPNFFFWRIMNCYGWGTWADRWESYNNNIDQTKQKFSFLDKVKFSFAGIANFWRQIKGNGSGKVHTWAIYWYATIFNNQGLCLTPKKSYAKNIGFDGSGVHTNAQSAYKNERVLNQESSFNFDEMKVNESDLAIRKAYWFYFMEDLTKIFRLLKNKIG